MQIALNEAGTKFDVRIVDLADPGDRARFLDLWPVGKMPVLHDSTHDETIPETSIIIEYLDQHYPGADPMLPADRDTRLKARLWDRFFDLYVQDPMQKIVLDRFRPDDGKDPAGVAEAEQRLRTAYCMVDRQVTGKSWAVGDTFGIADCAAAPALFFAGIVVPFGEDQSALHAYFERLLERPSFRQVLVHARPHFDIFPFRNRMPDRFLNLTDA